MIPVLCNHCDEPPCIKICPGNPEKAGPGKPYKAMFKTPEGITLHDPELCIGCGDCQTEPAPTATRSSAPSSLNGETYSVISLNPADENPQPFWADKTSAIPGCTSSGAEVAAKAGAHAADDERLAGRRTASRSARTTSSRSAPSATTA